MCFCASSTAPAHIRQIRAGGRIEGPPTPIHLRCTFPSRLRGRGVWQCRRAATLSGLLPVSRASPRSTCPQLLATAASVAGGVFSSRYISASWRTADLVDDQQLVSVDGAVHDLTIAVLAMCGFQHQHQIGRAEEAGFVTLLGREILSPPHFARARYTVRRPRRAVARCTARPRAGAGDSSRIRQIDQFFIHAQLNAESRTAAGRQTLRVCGRNRSSPWRGYRLQTLALLLEPHQRNLISSCVHARIGDLAQPGADTCVGSVAIDREPFGTELARQRYVEARAQVANEAFDLALGLRPIRPAQPRHEPVMMREVEEGAVGSTNLMNYQAGQSQNSPSRASLGVTWQEASCFILAHDRSNSVSSLTINNSDPVVSSVPQAKITSTMSSCRIVDTKSGQR